MSSAFTVSRASVEQLPLVAPLYDAYRQFYEQESDLELASRFLAERLSKEESMVLLAVDKASGKPAGFIQLFPSFSSVAADRIWVLNDLFVDPGFRRQGLARALMNAAKDFAKSTGAVRMGLMTANTNTQAQALYESLGYVMDTDYRDYNLKLVD
ncbi:MAG: GNAT family N-acetyltransferase [Opitutales bacterium]|nr:GNAT family N-acetyltransferase [Opitutales bacterium]